MNPLISAEGKISKATILIVDDNPNNVQLLKAVMTMRGFNVLVAKNGLHALETVKTDIPDLILLDIMMPEMDGFEACQKLKESPATANIPIIFLTAKSHIDDIMKGFELGAVDYITKPFSSNELVARVEIHLKLKFSQETVIRQRNELREMVQILCHDLSNPLGAVISSFELSEYDPAYLDQNKHLILSYVRRQYEIIGLVRELRAIAEKKSVFNLIPVNVTKAVNESIETLQYQLTRKNIKAVVSLEENTYVLAEKVSLINSVLNNLLTNAIKFSYPDSVITVSSQKKNGKILITISDKGMGIPNDLKNKIYAIDRRNTRFGTMGEKGTGFGMPLVKKFVTEYGGTIDITSKDENEHPQDHGTLITLSLRSAAAIL
ncbi:MAG: hybrid sensor histidine kinase/response regulator [Desulfobacteraceae bacterium]